MTLQDVRDSAGEASLVPPARLAGLLSQHRRRHELEIVDLARRSDGRFSAGDLAAIELGRTHVSGDTFDRIVELYQIESEPIMPGRSELVLDLVDNQLRVEDWHIEFDSPTVDDVLERYVALLQIMRDAPLRPGMSLREDDLSVLSLGLQRPIDTIRHDLRSLVATPRVSKRVRRLRRLSSVAGAGVLVAVTAAGALVLVRVDQPASEPAALAVEPLRVEASLASSVGLERIVVTPSTSGAALEPSVPAAAAPPPVLSARAAAIESAIPWDFRTVLPSWTIDYAGPHPDWRGVANSVERTITLYDRADTTPAEAAEVLVHELGHAIDLVVLTEADRFEWLAMRAIEGPWWAEDGRSDFSVGAGDFAEAVAALVVGSPSRSDFGPFDNAQLEWVSDRLPGFEPG